MVHLRHLHVYPFIFSLTLSVAAVGGQSLNVSPTADMVGGKRTGVTVFLGEAFDLRLSVDGQLSQGDERLHICENPFYLHCWKEV